MPSLIPIDPEELNQLTDSYSDREIAKILGTSHGTIVRARARFGIQTHREKTGLTNHRKKDYGEPDGRWEFQPSGVFKADYFRSVDTPSKAYWLGYAFADGWSSFRNNKPKELGFACHPEDAYHLHRFREEIQYGGAIVTRVNQKTLAKSGKSRLSTFRVTQQAFTGYAVQAGVIQRKSSQLSLTRACLTYPSHFVRGYFDGDGSISQENFCYICNTEAWMKQLRWLIYQETGQELKAASTISPTTDKATWRLIGLRSNRSVAAWMYQSASTSLDRKYIEFSRFWK